MNLIRLADYIFSLRSASLITTKLLSWSVLRKHARIHWQVSLLGLMLEFK